MPGRLYVVSTPIGNLDDITLRALTIFKTVSLIAAEDTRRTGILLRHFGIPTPLTSLHEHNERRKMPVLLARLQRGDDIALASDAGTPLVSDPGEHFLRAAIENGIPLVPVPGPSAVLAALSVSGFPTESFLFLGFPPNRSHSRKEWLSSLSAETRTVVFFEAPHRIHRTLKEMSTILVDRPITICRELTKLHEETIRTTSGELLTVLPKQKGEFTIVIGPPLPGKSTGVLVEDKQIRDYFEQLTNNEGYGRRAAISEAAHIFGLSTKSVYLAVERMKSRPS